MTRAEHLAWCKRRALEYLEAGRRVQAVTSMISDLRKHPETASSAALALLAVIAVKSDHEARRFIEGFN